MFLKAKPIWLKGLTDAPNCFAAFCTEVVCEKTAELHISASTFYRVWFDGQFIAFGPARAAKGYARVDIISLAEVIHTDGPHQIRIEVAGYNCRSLSTVLQPSFVIAEIRQGNTVLCSTGTDFIAYRMAEKVQAVERYSQQRHYGEVWDYTLETETPCPIECCAPLQWLPRVAPYPYYENIERNTAASVGTFLFNERLPYRNNRYSFEGGEFWGCFSEAEIPYKPYRWIQRQQLTVQTNEVPLPCDLNEGEYIQFDFDQIQCGFIQFVVTAETESDIVIGFTEYCEKGTFAFTKMNVQNVLEYKLPIHFTKKLLSFEPYTFRSVVLLVKSGQIQLQQFGVKTFERDTTHAFRPKLADASLQAVYDAALRTFAHNAVDLFSDCPSRERAGWLCDSYFTGIAEYFFFGCTPTEDAFLENYRLYTTDERIPNGMLPKCYPADSGNQGTDSYIPQWCLWYILEVKEYLTERNPQQDTELFRDSVEGILRFLAPYENEDGLLENLPGWNFVEWSDANTWTQNVNYPTNFLYAEALRCAYTLYGQAEWLRKAQHICRVAAEQSFDGTLFTDNAVRVNGRLRQTGNTSEACQYYALLFGNIDFSKEKFIDWAQQMRNGFSDHIKDGRPFVPVNAFIGLYLRIKALLKLQWYDVLLQELNEFFGGMVEKTGTLWEYRQQNGSYDHGFASFAAPALYASLQGLNRT